MATRALAFLGAPAFLGGLAFLGARVSEVDHLEVAGGGVPQVVVGVGDCRGHLVGDVHAGG